jgi:hypothetical protein
MSHAKQLHNRRYLHDYLEIIHRHGLPGHVKSAGGQQLPQAVTPTVKGLVEHTLEDE